MARLHGKQVWKSGKWYLNIVDKIIKNLFKVKWDRGGGHNFNCI